MSHLLEAVQALAIDERVRVISLSGSGAHFCSGADTADIGDNAGTNPKDRVRTFVLGLDELIHPLIRVFTTLKQPVVASARGYAIGIGLQLLLMADLVVASDTLKCMLPQVRLGHTLDHGESWFLPRRIGFRKAMELSLLAEPVDADAALTLGLVNWVARDKALDIKTKSIVTQLAASAPTALWRTKALLHHSVGATLEAQLDAEREHVSACVGSHEFTEAMAEFTGSR